MSKRPFEQELLEKIEFYVGCEASAKLKHTEKDDRTAYHFHLMANTILEVLEDYKVWKEREE